MQVSTKSFCKQTKPNFVKFVFGIPMPFVRNPVWHMVYNSKRGVPTNPLESQRWLYTYVCIHPHDLMILWWPCFFPAIFLVADRAAFSRAKTLTEPFGPPDVWFGSSVARPGTVTWKTILIYIQWETSESFSQFAHPPVAYCVFTVQLKISNVWLMWFS